MKVGLGESLSTNALRMVRWCLACLCWLSALTAQAASSKEDSSRDYRGYPRPDRLAFADRWSSGTRRSVALWLGNVLQAFGVDRAPSTPWVQRFSVPARWEGKPHPLKEGERLGRYGFATYALRVMVLTLRT